MTLKELEILVTGDTRDRVFGDDPDAQYLEYAELCSPSRHPEGREREYASDVMKLLQMCWADYNKPALTIRSGTRQFLVGQQVASGDVADVFVAECDSMQYLLKIARTTAANAFLQHEQKVIDAIWDGAHTLAFIPRLIDSFVIKHRDRFPRHVNVFPHVTGYYSPTDILGRHMNGVDGGHVGWMFKRLLSVLGIAHDKGFAHAAVLPQHVLFHTFDHGILLVDWTCACHIGANLTIVPRTYRDWYPEPELKKVAPVGPAMDIYMAAKCMRHLTPGGSLVPSEIISFLRSCMVSTKRPTSAWDLLNEFDDVLVKLYGPRYSPTLVMA